MSNPMRNKPTVLMKKECSQTAVKKSLYCSTNNRLTSYLFTPANYILNVIMYIKQLQKSNITGCLSYQEKLI